MINSDIEADPYQMPLGSSRNGASSARNLVNVDKSVNHKDWPMTATNKDTLGSQSEFLPSAPLTSENTS